jgi:hypothetical protein
MTAMADGSDDGFFSRWARRKAEVRRGAVPPEPPREPAHEQPAPTTVTSASAAAPLQAPPPAAAADPASPATEAPPLPTMDDVTRLTRSSDYSRFVTPGVDENVKRAALKRLFTDPHFNLMDGLDVYIDDYGQPDPLPASMLRKLAQSKALGLFTDPPAPLAPAAAAMSGEPEAGVASASGSPADGVDAPPPIPAPAPEAVAEVPPDEDADLRLQPLDAAGREGDPRDPGEDAGRER